jgi:hypothetical protein
MVKIITNTLSDDELANYPSYGWPITCPICGSGSGMGNKVKAPDCDGVSFRCTVCNAQLHVRRRGNEIIVVAESRRIVLWKFLSNVSFVLAFLTLLYGAPLPAVLLAGCGIIGRSVAKRALWSAFS